MSTAVDLYGAVRKGIEQGSGWPIAREVVRQTTPWGMAIAMAGDGAAVGGVLGNFIGGPPGAVVGAVIGGLVGGLVGGIAGFISGSWLTDLF